MVIYKENTQGTNFEKKISQQIDYQIQIYYKLCLLPARSITMAQPQLFVLSKLDINIHMLQILCIF